MAHSLLPTVILFFHGGEKSVKKNIILFVAFINLFFGPEAINYLQVKWCDLYTDILAESLHL